MEQKHLKVDTAELIEAYRELLPQVESLPLTVSGHSMSPFLADKRDVVHLAKIKEPLKIGDIVLYQRDNGQYILHRICKVNNDSFSIIGDAHDYIETGIRKDQIIEEVKSVERKGKTLAPGNICWEFFSKIWIRIIPFRKNLMKLASFFYKLFRRNKNESIK